MSNFCPDWVSPPGETIQTVMQEREMSLSTGASLLNLEDCEMADLLLGLREIDEELAGKLSVVLGSSKGFWLRRESGYREDLKRLGISLK